jgi:hypothetical protein
LRVAPFIDRVGCWFGPGIISSIDAFEPRSWPEENIGPTPPRMTTRTSSSASARRNASCSSTRRPRFCAFRDSGRLSMMRTIRPSLTGS